MKESGFYIPIDRRRFFKSIAAASAGFMVPGFLAEALTVSPVMTQGPFYPLARNIPLDRDNDLVRVDDSLTLATGQVCYLGGRILGASGNPIRGALVELWHADHEGDYLYSSNAPRNPACDPNFAGFGQFLTGSTGEYLFRTIKAGLYPGRTRHFHLGVTIPGRNTRTTTQTYWNETAIAPDGQAWSTQNTNDGVLVGVTNTEQRASVILNYTPVPETTTGESQATFDFVSGFTPVEPTYPGGNLTLRGTAVAGDQYHLTLPVYAGYTYEVYGNPTLANLGWQALPFSLDPAVSPDRNQWTAAADGMVSFYLTQKATKGFYSVSFRVPGANTGTP